MSLSIGGQNNTRVAEAAVYVAPPADPTIPLRGQPGEYLALRRDHGGQLHVHQHRRGVRHLRRDL